LSESCFVVAGGSTGGTGGATGGVGCVVVLFVISLLTLVSKSWLTGGLFDIILLLLRVRP
jgi:hypothetical protein